MRVRVNRVKPAGRQDLENPCAAREHSRGSSDRGVQASSA